MENLTDAMWMVLWLGSSIGLGIITTSIYTKIVDIQNALSSIQRKLNQQENKNDV